ncbi:MAG: aminotransferase class V-fold PLP-dependent enzyme [Longimicrobiales bacterium]
MTERLTCRRDDFSLPSGLHYLNCAYMSPIPRLVQEAGLQGVLRKADPSRITARDFFAESDRARALFAQLIGAADAHRIAIIPAASYGIATAARNTRVSAGQNVVITGEQFPSNVYSWRELCRRQRLDLRAIQPAEQTERRALTWNERVLDAIDANTAIVAMPQVHWTDGTRFDLMAMGKRAREVGAAFIIDGTQSVGALPFDVNALQPDALICAAYKWLLGPYSLGLAYFGPRYDGGEPLEENWIAREDSEDFRALVNYTDAYQPGALRYDVGERSNFALMPMLVAGLECVLTWSPQHIQQYCAALVAEPLLRAQELGYFVEQESGRSAHLFGLRMPGHVDLAQLHQELQQRRVFASLRGSALRVSPHLYNDDHDLAVLLAVLQSAVTSRATASAHP